MLRSEVAIDLGTVNSLIHVLGRGVVVDEPTAVAFRRPSGQLVFTGDQADAFSGKEPPDLQVVHPLRDGVISDLDAAASMLQAFLHRARFHSSLRRPRAIMCVPSGAGLVERQALVAAASQGRPRLAVHLVDEPVAAAVGAGLDPSRSDGALVVDIGGGTTEAALVVGARVTAVRSLRIGGNAFDEAIVQALKGELGLVVGRRAAEHLKKAVGLTGGDEGCAVLTGIDAALGTVCEQPVSGSVVASALEPAVASIVECVEELLWEMSPDLVEPVVRNKLQIAGGGALLPGIADRLEGATGITTVVVEDPLRAVVRGAASLLEGHFGTLGPSN